MYSKDEIPKTPIISLLCESVAPMVGENMHSAVITNATFLFEVSFEIVKNNKADEAVKHMYVTTPDPSSVTVPLKYAGIDMIMEYSLLG